MQTYLELQEFCKLVHLNEDVVKGMMANGALNFKEEEGKIYIEANQGTFSVVPSASNSKPAMVNSMTLAGESFVEKTIGTILNLHEKVLDAKDETLDALNNELKHAREEIEFLKRKYKLMWSKTAEIFGARTEPDLEMKKDENSSTANEKLNENKEG